MDSSQVSVNGGLGEENVVYIRDGILLSHKNEILSYATKWIQMKTMALGEITQTQEDKRPASLICGS